MNLYKFNHFYLNKYVVSRFQSRSYYLAYNYKYKLLWYRVAKVGSSTIDQHLETNTPKDQYIFSSEVSYVPAMFKSYLKFAFVRNPIDRFISSWRNKVVQQNYFQFSAEDHKKMQDIDNFISWVKTLDIESCDQHLRSQTSLIDLNHIDRLGRMESFAEDFSEIMTQAEVPFEKIIKKNPSKKMPVELSENQIETLRGIYSKDFQILYPNS